VSVGAGNRFGHPAASTLDLLVRSGIPVLRTDQVGDVKIDPRSERGRIEGSSS
jgi:competence protein ComEC